MELFSWILLGIGVVASALIILWPMGEPILPGDIE